MGPRGAIAVKKYWIATIVVLSFFLVTAAGFPKPALAEVKYLFKLGTLAPKGIGWTQEWVNTLLPGLVAATNNEMNIKTYC